MIKSVIIILAGTAFCTCANAAHVIVAGPGEFAFDYKISGQNKKMPVYYFAPKSLTQLSRIVFVLHGDSRSGKLYRDEWQSYANQYKFLVLCPEFSDSDFGGWWKYNYGNMYDPDKHQNIPRQDWAFNIIEELFDFVRSDREMKAQAYCIYGHSAGAQFVHRMVLAMPQARFSLAIANGAGNYTDPTFDKNFPNGLGHSDIANDSLAKSFSKNMIILMGERDLVSKTMPQTESSFDKYDRVWKAKRFFSIAKDQAQKLQVNLNWRFVFVPNADHINPAHAQYGSRLAANSRIFLTKPADIATEPNETVPPGGTEEISDHNEPLASK